MIDLTDKLNVHPIRLTEPIYKEAQIRTTLQRCFHCDGKLLEVVESKASIGSGPFQKYFHVKFESPLNLLQHAILDKWELTQYLNAWILRLQGDYLTISYMGEPTQHIHLPAFLSMLQLLGLTHKLMYLTIGAPGPGNNIELYNFRLFRENISIMRDISLPDDPSMWLPEDVESLFEILPTEIAHHLGEHISFITEDPLY